MVVDSSALLAILLKEPERDALAAALAAAPVRLLSSVNAFEAAIVVLARKGEAGLRELDLLLHAAAVDVVPFAAEHLALAREGYERFGKGRHPAGLNLGDCAAYALARHSGEPLLFKGEDFARTDVRSALAT
jgi:ribonuclease VapC